MLTTYTVDSTGDLGDSDTLDGICDDGSGACTFRAGIEQANAAAGADSIAFDIGGGGAQTIGVSSALPQITGTVTIDGSTQPGFTGTPLINVDAQGLGGEFLSVSAPDSTLNDFRISNASFSAVVLRGDNAVVEGLEIVDPAQLYGSDLGINASSVDGLTIQNVSVSDVNTGIIVSGGSDAQVLNNDISNANGTALTVISAATGLRVQGNSFSGGGGGVGLINMSDLIISDGSIAGSHVILEDNSGLTTVGGRFRSAALVLRNIDNSLVEGLNLSDTAQAHSTDYGVRAFNVDTLTIRNVEATNRWFGIEVDSGTDVQVLNNDLSTAGSTALTVQGVTSNVLPGGLLLQGNTFHGGFEGVDLKNMSGLTISNGSVPGSQVILEDTSGLNTAARVALKLQNVADSLIDSLFLSDTAQAHHLDTGISANNSDNLTIRNVTATDKGNSGIQVFYSADVQVLNNDLSRAFTALQFDNITSNALSGGILVQGNTLTGSARGVRLANMSGLTISNGSIAGSHVILEDTSGLATTSDAAVLLHNIDNSLIDGLTFSDSTQAFNLDSGIQAGLSDNLTIQNITATDKRVGISVHSGNNVQINCSTIHDSTFRGVWWGNTTGGVMFDNDISGNSTGVLNGTADPLINAENNYWGATDGPSNLGGAGDSYSGNVDADPFLTSLPACLIANQPPDAPTDSDVADNDVSEGALDGSTVGVTASAFDPDVDTLVYSLTDDAGGRFTIDSGSGVVTVAMGGSALLNHEDNTSHTISVQAEDPSGETSSADFMIEVLNVDPSTPIDANGADNEVGENAADDSLIGVTATASDPNGTVLGGNVTYNLADDAGGRFAIDAATGVVTVATGGGALLDFENATSHNITVEASDGVGGTSTEDFTISVNDVNEAPTDIQLSAAAVDENMANGTVIGTLSATDPDTGDTFTFSDVVDPDGKFAVVGNELQVDGTLDFEAQTSHHVTIRVVDGGGLIFDKLFTISVNDVNEAPTVDPATFSIDENSPDTTSVDTVTASDPDAGDNVTFSITGGNTGGAFTIDGTTGEIRVNDSAALDFETMPTFHLTVQAQDTGSPGLTGTAIITVNLNDIDPVAHTLAVIDAVEDLKDTGVLGNGQANPVLNHLEQAIKHWNKGKTAQAVQKLEQARGEIQDLIDDGDLDSALGEPLIDLINDVIKEILTV